MLLRPLLCVSCVLLGHLLQLCKVVPLFGIQAGLHAALLLQISILDLFPESLLFLLCFLISFPLLLSHSLNRIFKLLYVALVCLFHVMVLFIVLSLQDLNIPLELLLQPSNSSFLDVGEIFYMNEVVS